MKEYLLNRNEEYCTRLQELGSSWLHRVEEYSATQNGGPLRIEEYSAPQIGEALGYTEWKSTRLHREKERSRVYEPSAPLGGGAISSVHDGGEQILGSTE